MSYKLVLRRPRRSRRAKGLKSMRGAGFMDFLSKANSFLKNNKIISSVGEALGKMGVPLAGSIGSAAGALGYGRRKSMRGKALRLAGGGLSLSGRRRVRRRA
jgi:hypothetical protein